MSHQPGGQEDVERLRGALADRQTEIASLREAAERDRATIDGLEYAAVAAEHELLDLRAIRDALVSPAHVERDGMTIAADLIPAEAQVGGDFYFVGDGPRGTAVLAVGDVVGKGLAAARRAAFTRTALASVAGFSDDPTVLLQWVNTALVERIGVGADLVTAFCVTYDPADRRLRAASAGHPPAVRLPSGGELTGGAPGAALGLERHIGGSAQTETLDPGDGVLLVTDGVLEARSGDSTARYGAARLRAALAAGGPEPEPEAGTETVRPRSVLERVIADLRAWVGGPFTDDVCLLALQTR